MRLRFSVAVVCLLSCHLLVGQAESDLELEVVRIFEASCAKVGCHVGPTSQMGMRLTEKNFYASIIDEPSRENPNLKLVDPGNPEQSYMLKKLRGDADIVGLQMPMTGALADEDIATIESWIRSIENVDQSRKVIDDANAIKPFDGWQILNLPTTQTSPKGTGLFRISHRFNPSISDGFNAFYGLDGSAIIFLGMGYAFTDNFHVSLGRTNASDNFEFQGRYRFFDQTSDNKYPFSISIQSGWNWISDEPLDPDDKRFRGEAMKFSTQLTITKKIQDKFGLAFVPGILFNPDENQEGESPMITLGLGGRWNFGKRMSWLFEWAPIVSGYTLTDTFGNLNRFDSWGTAFEIATGGHSFQIALSNSVGIASDQYFRGGDLDPRDFFKGDIRLGFNIYRVLNYKKSKTK